MKVRAILCDSASVREGLLNILGGGITQLWRESYPAQFFGALAMLVSPEHSELTDSHKIQIRIMGEDGESILDQSGEFSAHLSDGTAKPGGVYAIPFVVILPPLVVPRPGNYSIHIRIDRLEMDSLTFRANDPGERPGT